MFIEQIKHINNELDSIGATNFAEIKAMKKSRIFTFKISDIKLSAALILKQESLAVGGDFITSKDVILCQKEYYCGILIATQSQLEKIIAKCFIQPFGLKKMANILEQHLQNTQSAIQISQNAESALDFMSDFANDSAKDSASNSTGNFANSYDFMSLESHNKIHFKSRKIPQIMGIINITHDSFYEDSRITDIDKILQTIETMIENNVAIIDIGGTSSRPDSKRVESSEELERLKEPLNAIFNAGFTKKAIFSIDSYHYECVKFALNKGFSIINDIEGLCDMRMADLAKDNSNKIVLMHNSWLYPHSQNIIQSVDDFFAKKIESLLKIGIKQEQIILDVGFGFGKNSVENLALIRNLTHFKHFGCEILVGASMKRTIGEITNKDTKQRIFGTLALHQIALDNGADIIRCHDFKAHIDMLKIWLSLN